MSEIKSVNDVEDTLKKIVIASRNQPSNQDEILKLLKQIPILSKSILPISYHTKPVSSSHSDVLDLFKSISNHLTSQLKQLVHTDVTKDRSKCTCICLENLALLAGCEFAKEKFAEVLTHATYLLTQENMEFVEDPIDNLPKIANGLVSLVHSIKPLVLDMSEALFLCDVLNITFSEQMNMITTTILEKLSIELLTVVDALKEHAIKTSSGKISNFLGAKTDAGEDSISTINLLSLSSIVNSFIELEMSLYHSMPSKVERLKNSSDKLKKSSLKHRLPDILRSSQEASWTRSLTIYGAWDWQEMLRDIATSIANSFVQAFEDLHTKEMSSLRNTQSDDAYQIDIATSLSSEWLHVTDSPRRTISQVKEVLTLIKSTLPYGVLGSQYKPLSTLLSCYIDECSQSLKMTKSYLSMLLNDFPENVNASILLHAIAACEDVALTLQFCSVNINTEVRAPFQGICQSYDDMKKTLKSAVIQYLCTRIRLNVLHDGDSNHFNDPKEFADGERHSFAIENWKRFLGRLWKDMDTILSNASRNEIFSEIFLDSLVVLKMRYLRCQPTFNRTKQLCLDIPYITGTCEEYLLLNRSMGSRNIPLFSDCDCTKISAICQLLHAVLTIMTVPLNVLRECLSNVISTSNASNSPSLQSITIQFLDTKHDDQVSLVECLVTLFSNECSFLYFVLSDDFKEELGIPNIHNFHRCLYDVLASGESLWSDEFSNCALQSVNNDYHLLAESCLLDWAHFKHSWQQILFCKLDDILCQSLVSAVSFLCYPCWSPFVKDLISCLPCAIKASVSNMASKDVNTKNRLMVSVVLILLGLKQALYALPEWLVKFLTKLGSKTRDEAEKSIINDGIRVILKGTERVLASPDIWEENCHLELTVDGIDAMRQAKLILSHICMKNFEPTTDTEKVALRFLNSFIKEAHEYFRLLPETEFQPSVEQLRQQCRQEVAEMRINDKNSYDSLQKVAKTLNRHSDWFKRVWMKKHEDQVFSPNSMHGLKDSKEKCVDILSKFDWKTIEVIVSHRWEAKKGAALKDKQVDDLEAILEILGEHG